MKVPCAPANTAVGTFVDAVKPVELVIAQGAKVLIESDIPGANIVLLAAGKVSVAAVERVSAFPISPAAAE
jgi:hypothetical protein